MSADHSCRAAVARFIAHRVSRDQSACSAKTSAYCQARKRLPEEFFSSVARLVGKTLAANVDTSWLWKDRHVFMFDGTTVTSPIRARIKPLIRRSTIKDLGWVSQSPESARSCHCRAAQFSTWGFVVTQAKARARSVCCEKCWGFYRPATSY